MENEELVLTIQNVGTFSLKKGESVLSVLEQNDLLSFSHCGGNGTCGKCRVRFVKGAPLPRPGDRRSFSAGQLREGWRLACLAKPNMDCELVFELPQEKMTVLTGSALRQEIGNIGESISSEQCSRTELQTFCKHNDDDFTDTMVIIDLGTTTVVMQLAKAESGRVLDTYTAMNPQRRFGADVITRMQRAMEGDAQLLTECIGHCLKNGMEKWLEAGFAPEFAILAGNTVMIHLLLGLDVTSLAKAPFQPVTTACRRYEKLGIPAFTMPGISAFVGGDIMAGILACRRDMKRDKLDTALLVDLGTNGELALLQGDHILCSATAAGPAFEGGATANVPGADMIRIVAGLRRSGLVDETGLMMGAVFENGIMTDGVLIRQEDIRGLQMAKAAVFAGICILLKESGLSADDVQKVYLAGGFGYYLDVEAACEIGVFPAKLRRRVRSVGNAALAGAVAYAQDLQLNFRQSSKHKSEFCSEMSFAQDAEPDMAQKSGWGKEDLSLSQDAERIRKTAKSINLAQMEGFQEMYVDAMYLRSYD